MGLPVIPARGQPCLENGCSACCHDVEMVLTNDDVARIEGVLARRPALRRRVGPFYRVAADGFLELATRGGASPDPCVFLARGRCTIHEDRPAGCRLYPAIFDVDLRAAELDDAFCPHTHAFVLRTATRAAVADLAGRLQAEAATRHLSGTDPIREP